MVFPLEFLLLFGLCLTIDGINMLPLGPWNISSGLTISGFSSGAFMTVQMHMAHSSIFSGAAAFAGVSEKKYGIWICSRLFRRLRTIVPKETLLNFLQIVAFLRKRVLI